MIRDHLGNVRVRFADLNTDKNINSVNQGPGVGERFSVHITTYPFGMKTEGIFFPQELGNDSYQYNASPAVASEGGGLTTFPMDV